MHVVGLIISYSQIIFFYIGYRLHDLDIAVGNHIGDMSIYAHYIGPAANNEHLVFHRSQHKDARYVNLSITQGPGILQVSEVIVIAHPVCW